MWILRIPVDGRYIICVSIVVPIMLLPIVFLAFLMLGYVRKSTLYSPNFSGLSRRMIRWCYVHVHDTYQCEWTTVW